MNKSSQFLLPLVKAEGRKSNEFFIDSYLGDGTTDTLGNNLYLLFSKQMDAETSEKYVNATNFSTSYEVPNGVMYVFTLTEDEREKVVKPFLQGKYSELDKDYVEKHFPLDPKHSLYGNRLVIEKSDKYVKYWSEQGVEIPANAEVWSRPDLTNETYNYESIGQMVSEA
jgi:hypothetical protein